MNWSLEPNNNNSEQENNNTNNYLGKKRELGFDGWGNNENNEDAEKKVFSVEPLKMTGHEGNNYTFEAVLTPTQFGQYKSAVRMYPKNKNLPHRQDFCYVKWLELPAFNG